VGAGVDIGAYEFELLSCGDGVADSGEQCGEPGLACADPCTHCVQCTCVPSAPVCGDGLVCGAEECESDGQCATGAACTACQCVSPPVCASGISLRRASLALPGSPFRLWL